MQVHHLGMSPPSRSARIENLKVTPVSVWMAGRTSGEARGLK